MSSFIIKFLQTKSKIFPVFRIVVCKILHNGRSSLVDCIGFYFMNPYNKFISVNASAFGFWLNKGAFFKPSVLKLLRKFILKKI